MTASITPEPRFLTAESYEAFIDQSCNAAGPDIDQDYIRGEIALWASEYDAHRMGERAAEMIRDLGGAPFHAYLDASVTAAAVASLQRYGALASPGFLGFVLPDQLFASLGASCLDSYPVAAVSSLPASEPAAFLILSGLPCSLPFGNRLENDYRSRYIRMDRFQPVEAAVAGTGEKTVVLYPLYREIHTVAMIAGEVRRVAGDRFSTMALVATPVLDNEFDQVICEPFRYLWPLVLKLFSKQIMHLNVGWGVQALPLAPFLPDREKVLLDFYEVLSFIPAEFFEKLHTPAVHVRAAEKWLFQNFHYVMHLCSEETTERIKAKYAIDSDIVSVTEYIQPPLYNQPSGDPDKIRIVYGGYTVTSNSPNDHWYQAFMNVVRHFSQENLHLYIYNSPYLFGLDRNAGLEALLEEQGLTQVHSCMPLPLNDFVKEIAGYDFGATFIRPKDANAAGYDYFMATKVLCYLRAGLPVLIDADNKYMAGLIKKYGIGVVLEDEDYPRLGEILRSQDLARLKENVVRHRGLFAIDIAARKVLGLYDRMLRAGRPVRPEATPQTAADAPESGAGREWLHFRRMLDSVARSERRLYYRDQTPESLCALVQLVRDFRPTVIVELGTCSGMSLRAWIEAKGEAKIYALDLSFEPLIKSLELLPADLSKVTAIQQDIRTVDFASLWSPGDRVVFYIDAHDLPDVRIMDHVLDNVVPLLPAGSIVAVDDLWQSPVRLTEESSYDFYLNTVCPQFDPIIYRELSYAPYWEGGSFAGFLEVIPLMKWCNAHSVALRYRAGIKMGHFVVPAQAQSPAPVLTPEAFSRLTGEIHPKPLAGISASGAGAAARKALEICEQGVELFEADNFHDASRCFEEARRIAPETRGAAFASAVCLARLGDFAAAVKLLELDLQGPAPHANSATVLEDIRAWIGRHETPPCRADDQAGVTFFTTPKAFAGHFGIIQRNAIASWQRLSLRPRIILFGDEPGTAELARELGLEHVPTVRCNERRTPLISDMFEQAQALSSTSWVCYLNADIVLLEDFCSAFKMLPQDRQLLAIGRRWDFEVQEPLDFFAPQWEPAFAELVRCKGQLHSNSGIDYFIFKRNSIRDIPDFAVGRPGWDNWLLWHARAQGIGIVDATRVITAVHQEHSYAHMSGGVKEYATGAECLANRELAQGKVLTIEDADYTLVPDGALLPKVREERAEGRDFSHEEFVASKFGQALTALQSGRATDSLDHLDNVAFHAGYFGVPLPDGFHFRKAAVHLQLDQSGEALAEAEIELDLCPANREAQALKQCLEILEKKRSVATPRKGADRDAAPARRPSCLFVNTFYPGFLNDRYGKRPALATASYREQLDALQRECFGDSDFYSEGLKKQGWLAEDLIVNATQLQTAWAKEHGFPGSGLAVAVEQIRRARPDVVYLQDLSLASKTFIEAIREFTTLIVAQIASPLPDVHYQGIDLVVSSFPHFVKRFRAAGITACYQPLAFDPRVLQRTPEAPRDIPVSFVGGISPSHGKGLETLERIAAAVNVDFWGYGARELAPGSPIAARHHGEAWGRDMFSLLRRSRITLNRHIDVAEDAANNMRLFEATGCGALLITDYKENLGELFEIGKEVVAYRSPEECVALVQYYLAHPEEAEAIAKAGQERTLRDHCYDLRMAQTSEMLQRQIRYRSESGRLPTLDLARISCGHTPISAAEITPELASAWRDGSIPAKQRALVQQELAAMYRGETPVPFQVLAEVMRPITAPGAQVLEIGCASGYYYEILEYLLNRRIDYTGVDYSEAMIAMARDYYPKARFFAADGADLFFADRQFRTVISSCVLLHVPNYREHIFETARVAERHIVASRTPVCKRRPTQYQKKFAYGVETMELVFNEEELVREFALNRFELERAVEYQGDAAADLYVTTYLFRRR